MNERRYTDRQIYGRVLREARPYWGHIVAIFLITLIATPLALLTPVPLKIAVDNVLGHKPLPDWLAAIVPDSFRSSTTALLVLAVVLLVVVELLSQLQSLSKTLLRTYTSEHLALQLRSKLFHHAQLLSLGYHDRKGTADANYRIQSDAAAIPSVAVDGVIPFVAAGFMFASMILVIVRIDPVLALIALLVAPILVALTYGYRRSLRARHREVKALESSALAVVQEVLTSVRVVKAFGQEQREERRFTIRAAQGMRARLRVALVDGSFWVAISLVTVVGTGSVLFVGVRGVQSGSLTLGSLLLVIGYLSQLYSPLYTMSSQVAALQSGFASSERAFTLLDEERDVPERADARPLGRAAGAVEFRDVSFAYDAGRPVVERVSFSVEPGMRVGIAGRTGAGKTTLVSLLTRFYDPTEGSILVDGVDIRDYRLADLRDQFAIVLQEPVLFSTTIAENIAYGRPDAAYLDIVAAAKAADVHDFIETLPEGYDTPVGERGMTLSGGERQRISLARAFLRDAPILILDEPTSSVDLKTEATIIDAMERLMSGRTTFVIAHRLSTLDGCDIRLQVESGRLSRGIVRAGEQPLERSVPLRSPSGRRVTGLLSAFASAARAFTLLDEEQDVFERADARPLGRAAGAVEFRDVSFAYDAGRPVVERVSFSVEPGMRVGIAGRTGAGKTTLVSLLNSLTRFYDPTSGAILLDGVDIRDYRLADLRDQFAIVLQEPVLFSTTIAENIAYGRPDAAYLDIVAAAKAADVHDFIETLPEGYDTPVGERGMTLSGGERQRISLARAFLRDAPILILDEPTSSVDLKTEATIIDAMERLMSGRTTFVIAHRLSTLDGCDIRLQVESGRLSRGIVRAGEQPLERSVPLRSRTG